MYAIVAVVDMDSQVRDAFLALTLESVRGAHGAPGRERFDVVEPPDNPNRMGFYEVYRDRADVFRSAGELLPRIQSHTRRGAGAPDPPFFTDLDRHPQRALKDRCAMPAESRRAQRPDRRV